MLAKAASASEKPYYLMSTRSGVMNRKQIDGMRDAGAFAALGDASRSRTFWLFAGSFFICGASTNGLIGAHLVPACGDRGIPETRAAGLLALMGLFDLCGTTMSGWLSDRCDSRWLLFWYYGLRGLSLLFLPFAFGLGLFGLPLFVFEVNS